MKARLLPVDGSPPIDITKDLTIVGRKEDCDFRLDHKSVSKMHCVLVKTDGLIVLRDLGSTNGTRVNGVRVRRSALLPHDKLSVANFHFRVLFGAALNAAEQTEQTQQLDLEELREPIAPNMELDSVPDEPIIEVQQNALPDVYP